MSDSATPPDRSAGTRSNAAPSEPDQETIAQDMERAKELRPVPDESQIREARTLGPDAPGTGARGPWAMSRAGWKLVLQQVFSEVGSSQTSLSAAGCAFYATLSLFPAMSSLISLYGLAFDLQTVEPQLQVLRNLLPPAAYDLIGNRIHELISQPHSSLTIGLIFSLSVALWSASASTKSILAALNMAYNAQETRSFLRFQAVALSTTLMAIVGAALTLALMVAAPALVDYLPKYLGLKKLPPPFDLFVSYGAPMVVHTVAPLLMLLFVFLAVTLLYRFAPCRQHTKWRWIFPGSAVSTLLWVITSLGFSWYVAHFASYGATYGPLGAVAAIMMWFFVSAYVVLFGAELNASLEDRARGRQPRITGQPRPDPIIAKAVAGDAARKS
ncbi:T-RNA-processing ribonuclease BN [Gluconobacter morbifer G707]|uniref:T-RNA-processing ribonuclease BN n=2 Tax=Gluconobacter TaxID=441 RepID=G6XLS7_9PROT|nr:YihY/virulence factor BrkB family protein [Gluconobacter morbifer]EHH67332.1 T-RNA-processing ribonuclease BN [Gluconobacter morbifer G707]